MKVFVTTDTHFGHRSLINKLQVRPSDFEEKIIRNRRVMISEDDLFVHLSDVVIGTPDDWHSIIPDLPGRKILVRGNHDKKSPRWYMANGFDFCCSSITWEMFGFKILLSHKPSFEGDFDLNIHGHLHGSRHHDIATDKRHHLLALEDTGYQPRLLKTLVENWTAKRQEN